MKVWSKEAIRKRLAEVLPEGKVIPKHNSQGHFYEVQDLNSLGLMKAAEGYPIYPSVTGKLQVLKDEGLINYKMNRAIEYLQNYLFSLPALPNMEQILDATKKASLVSQDVLLDAADVGTIIHDTREAIFRQWIETGVKPDDFLSFIPPECVDVRVVSAIRALKKFVDERDYIPVACEMLLYSHELKVAGTLDDLGLLRQKLKEPDYFCDHEIAYHEKKGTYNCLKCDYKYRYQFVLMDLKSSNQFKDHYFFQVSLYWRMLWKLMGPAWKPEACFILKVSKENGEYKLEEFKGNEAKLAKYAMYMLKTNEAVDFIKSIRKDNQKKVLQL